jgi:alginate O-acetyltransferase complex protein AlgI
MVFNEPAFLFLLLPLALLVNTFSGQRFRNLFLLGLSLLFYFMGEHVYVVLMILSCGLNYGFGIWVGNTREGASGKRVIALTIAANLGILAVFKYTGFLLTSLNGVMTALGLSAVPVRHVHLPIGISFFTFQAISYLIDVYRGNVPVERKWWNLALYISLFPQLIAGPIVRYSQLIREVHHRTIHWQPFALGIERFILGLAKKTIIANTLAVTADAIFDLPPGQLSPVLAWIGLLAYTFQIYYDFSGYSDMAIGIGLMLGFQFPENFNYPYVAGSMTEFWRRWHISLSTWFRDYLYIPLGGNRKGNTRTALNLLLVFLLCGLWHGASWNFVIWGLCHGGFLMLERLPFAKRLLATKHASGLGYTWAVVLLSWVFFRCETFSHAMHFFHALFGASVDVKLSPRLYVDSLVLCAFFLALLFAGPTYPRLRKKLTESGANPGMQGVYVTSLILLFILCVSQVAANTYNPFIYFRF